MVSMHVFHKGLEFRLLGSCCLHIKIYKGENASHREGYIDIYMKSNKKLDYTLEKEQRETRQIDRIRRLKPRKVQVQQENLRQDINYLEKDISKLRRENKALSEDMRQVQANKDNYEHIILRVEDYIIGRRLHGPMKKESNLVIGMKTQGQTLRNSIKEHQDTLQSLRRTPQVQSSLEKEIEYEVMMEHQEKLQGQAKGFYRFEGGTQLEDSGVERSEAVQAEVARAQKMMA